MPNHTRINIIFRTCDKVNAVHKSPRPFDLEKKTLIKACFFSVYKAIQGFNYSITVLGDDISEEMRMFFLKFDIRLIEGVFGNDESIKETIKIAQQFESNEWVYFCEDDYLHKFDTFDKINTLIQEKETIKLSNIRFKKLLRKREITTISMPRCPNNVNIVILPYDYPDRYDINQSEKNFIFHTKDSHWRQVSDATFTFLMQVEDVKKHKKILLKASHRANDRYLSKKLFGKSFFFNKLLCLSPLPSLTTHMHNNTMSPLVDWKLILDDLLKEI